MNFLQVAFLLMDIFHASSQDGIFLSPKNYEMQQVWLPFSKDTQHLIERNDGVKFVGTSSYFFSSKNAYGYRKGQKEYRFWKNHSLEIVNSEGIFVYRLDIDSQSSSELYYFSKTATDAILPISRKNLKEVYKNDQPTFAENISLLDWYICLTDSIAPSGKLRVVELFQFCAK